MSGINFIPDGQKELHLYSETGKPYTVSVSDEGALQVKNETTGQTAGVGGGGGDQDAFNYLGRYAVPRLVIQCFGLSELDTETNYAFGIGIFSLYNARQFLNVAMEWEVLVEFVIEEIIFFDDGRSVTVYHTAPFEYCYDTNDNVVGIKVYIKNDGVFNGDYFLIDYTIDDEAAKYCGVKFYHGAPQ